MTIESIIVVLLVCAIAAACFLPKPWSRHGAVAPSAIEEVASFLEANPHITITVGRQVRSEYCDDTPYKDRPDIPAGGACFWAHSNDTIRRTGRHDIGVTLSEALQRVVAYHKGVRS